MENSSFASKQSNFHQFLHLFFILFFLQIIGGCTDNKSNSIKLIDITSEDNIIASPLTDKGFDNNKVSVTWLDRDMTEITLDNGEKAFLLPLKEQPVLDRATCLPSDLRVESGNKTINPYTGKGSGWEYISNTLIFNPARAQSTTPPDSLKDRFPDFVWFREVLYLNNGDASFSLELPGADKFEKKTYAVLFLDDHKLLHPLPPYRKFYKTSLAVKPGKHFLLYGLRNPSTIPLMRDVNNLLSSRIIVKTSSPSIIVHTDSLDLESKKSTNLFFFKAEYSVVQIPEMEYNPCYEPENREQTNHVAYIRGKEGLKNPVARQITVGGYAFSSLFAPAPTTLKYTLDIGSDAILKFGCGIVLPKKDLYSVETDSTIFSVSVTTQDGNIENIFSKTLSGQKDDFGFKLIDAVVDLRAYAGKTIDLVFSTNSVRGGISHPNAFWYNPRITFMRSPFKLLFSLLPWNHTKHGPNIILISLDTLRADQLGCYGCKTKTSPAIDRFSRDAVLFENCYATYPRTTVSHMSVFTALYPDRNPLSILYELKMNPGRVDAQGIPSAGLHLAEILSASGYKTGAFTGGGGVSRVFGFSKGFDFYFECNGLSNSGDSPELLFQRTAHWLDQNSDEKFFLFLHTYEIHDPYTPPGEYVNMITGKNTGYSSRLPKAGFSAKSLLNQMGGECCSGGSIVSEELKIFYDSEILYTDDKFIQPLIKYLKSKKLYNNTAIIITADHGEEFFEHGCWGHGLQIYDETIHVPLLIKYPGSANAGKRIKADVSLVDITPTILGIAGISSSGNSFDGIDLSDVINGKTIHRELRGMSFLYYHDDHEKERLSLFSIFYIKDGLKLIVNRRTPENARFFDDFPNDRNTTELFNLAEDPGEKKNIAPYNEPIVEKMLGDIQPVFKRASEISERQKNIVDSNSSEGSMNSNLREKMIQLGYW